MKNYLEFNQTQAFFSGPFFEPAFGIAAGLMSFRRDKMWEPSSTLLVQTMVVGSLKSKNGSLGKARHNPNDI
jgi:hypothetical protein